jgi:hypothetical protein
VAFPIPNTVRAAHALKLEPAEQGTICPFDVAPPFATPALGGFHPRPSRGSRPARILYIFIKSASFGSVDLPTVLEVIRDRHKSGDGTSNRRKSSTAAEFLF